MQEKSQLSVEIQELSYIATYEIITINRGRRNSCRFKHIIL